MNSNSGRTLWISLGLALLAMGLIYSYSQEKKAEYDQKYGARKRVVVAAADILEMSTIDDTMIDTIEMPSEFVQPGAVEDRPDLAIGQVAATPIKKGEQILATKLLTPGPNTGLSMQVAPNKRAITIPVDDVRGVGKLIRPGDRIDLITTIESGKGGPGARTEVRTLLQDVIVLATGVNVTNSVPRSLEVSGGNQMQFRNLNGDLSFSNITLEVTPKEAQDLIYVMTNAPGSIYVSLRNPNDRSNVSLSASTENSLMGRPLGQMQDNRIPSQIQQPQYFSPPPIAPRQPPAPSSQQPLRKRPGPFVDVK